MADTSTVGQTASLLPAESEAAGLAFERLAGSVPALNAQIEAGQLPGAVIAIARHGRLAFQKRSAGLVR